MAHRYFSSEKADYILELGSGLPFSKSSNKRFDSIDALVVETGTTKITEVLNGKIPAKSKHTDYAAQNNIPVFFPDCSPTAYAYLRFFISNLHLNLVTVPMGLFYAHTEGEINGFSRGLISTLYYLSQDPIVEARNAIAAEKIEGFIVPKVAQETGRRPRIGIVYDVLHVGIEDDIKSEGRRRLTLRNHKYFNFSRYANLKQVDVVIEATIDSSEWRLTEHSTGLFD